ncbi:hypothetical protein [Mesorhizobium sp. CAU 1741]|uniref:hypothetical protein n=1 Tax=Mesorhizobium sp. CAU 1741 TaxID=3140366 RepID=UPI00325AB043
MFWLKKIGGDCKSGIGADPARGMVPVTKLVAPSGKHVIHPGNDQMEILSTHVIERYDRRLAVVSPFPSVPRA